MRLRGLLAIGLASTALAGPPSIETFAARPAVEGAAISPDGRYLATIETKAGRGAVIVRKRVNGNFQGGELVLGEPEHFRLGWCRFATNTRLLCSFRGMGFNGHVVFIATRLVGVDADGRNMKVLIQNSQLAQGQSQDRIVHWHPGIADTC
jgi:hypothetical protein